MVHELLNWFDQNQREMPWRKHPTPYNVWVSELMLQQTQVATVIPYFLKWTKLWPNFEALAEATEEEVMAIWSGLGYYRRARALLSGAQQVTAVGKVPTNYDEWLEMPGVGPYTAAAIASISQGEQVALADGNVERVYARVVASEASGERLRREALEWSKGLIPRDRPGDWNQALMELGAVICTPRSPDCRACPLGSSCLARSNELQNELPRATQRPAWKEVVLWTALYERDGLWAVRPVPKGRWWQGLYEFPTFDSAIPESEALGSIRHTVTHHKITFVVVRMGCDEPPEGCVWMDIGRIQTLGMSAPMKKICAQFIDIEPQLDLQ